MEKLHRHFEDELERLSEKILQVGGRVEEAIARSLAALVDRDSDLARRVIAEDAEVDRLEIEIDQLCMELLALRQPMAGDLRLITTAMKIITDLERCGDLAVNVSERALELNEEPRLKPFVDIAIMARLAQEMVHTALNAFIRRDAEAARGVIGMDDALDLRMEQVFRELLSFMMEDPRATTRALRLIFIAKYLERIGDQATNIAEQVVFVVEGRVIKHPAVTAGSEARPQD